MKKIALQNWTAPNGTDYRVSLHEFALEAGRVARRIRRVEFESFDGRSIGSTSFPGYLSLHLVTEGELEELWTHAVGE